MPLKIREELSDLEKTLENQKAIFTVLITLGIHKILFPNQDIRNHMAKIPNGFNARSIDTLEISPTLGGLGLLYCNETGWVTRTLALPMPYNKKYPGEIKTGKKTFLNLVHFIQSQHKYAEDIVLSILISLNGIKKKHKIKLVPLKNPETLTLKKIVSGLNELISESFKSSGGAKLPVIMVYSCMKLICDQVKRYDGCKLNKLGSHLSADSKSKASGDLEIFKDNILLESYEIKFDVEITNHIIGNRIKDKIIKFNPKRYYVLSSKISKTEKNKIKKSIEKIRTDHGCQVLIDDPLELISRYLRVLNNLDEFVDLFSKMIIKDKELKLEHKETWQKIYNNLN